MKQVLKLKTLFILLLAVSLPFLLQAVQTVQQFFSQATGVKAKIVVDASLYLETMAPIWNSYSQGGEE